MATPTEIAAQNIEAILKAVPDPKKDAPFAATVTEIQNLLNLPKAGLARGGADLLTSKKEGAQEANIDTISDQLKTAQECIDKHIKQFKTQLKTATEENLKTFSQIKKLEDQIQELKNQREKNSETIKDLNSNINNTKIIKEYEESKKNNSKSAWRENDDSKKDYKKIIRNLERQLKESQEKNIDLSNKIIPLAETAEQTANQIRQQNSGIKNLEQKIKSLENLQQTCKSGINNINQATCLTPQTFAIV
jgi:chromosome segregation ATPase